MPKNGSTHVNTYRGCMPRKMVERMHCYLNDVEMDITDDAVLEEAKKVMLVALGSQAIAERVTGTRVMSRKEVLCDFARLDRDEGIEIHDRGLEQDHFPRPTHRGFGGTRPKRECSCMTWKNNSTGVASRRGSRFRRKSGNC